MAKPDKNGRCTEGHYEHIDKNGNKFCVQMHEGVNYSGVVQTVAGIFQRIASAVTTDSAPCGVCGKKKT